MDRGPAEADKVPEEVAEGIIEIAETPETKMAGPDPDSREAVQGQEAGPETGVHATQTTHPARPVTSIGASESPLGTVLTVMAVPGGTLRAQGQDTTEILLQQKKFQIENLTSSR